MDTKLCHCCGETKATTEFSLDRARPDKLHPQCKACNSLAHKRWRAANLEQVRARNRERMALRRAVSRGSNGWTKGSK